MKFFCALIFLLPLAPAAMAEDDGKKTTVEVELDPYYASVGLYRSLTGKPIPHMGAVPEIEIYRELVKNFYKPRTLVLEASINPRPYAGTRCRGGCSVPALTGRSPHGSADSR